MAWRMRLWRRVKILPGVTLNMSGSGPSVSIGPRGAKVTVGRKGIRQTVGLPGTGIYATELTPWERPGRPSKQSGPRNQSGVGRAPTVKAPRPIGGRSDAPPTTRRARATIPQDWVEDVFLPVMQEFIDQFSSDGPFDLTISYNDGVVRTDPPLERLLSSRADALQ